MENPTLSGSDSGAGAAKSLSVPQIDPIFSYPTEGGNVFVYLAKAGFATYIFVTFDDGYSEYAYAIETLVARPALVTKPFVNVAKTIWNLLEQAEKEFYNPFISNPFTQLLHDNEARTELIVCVQKLLEESGE